MDAAEPFESGGGLRHLAGAFSRSVAWESQNSGRRLCGSPTARIPYKRRGVRDRHDELMTDLSADIPRACLKFMFPSHVCTHRTCLQTVFLCGQSDRERGTSDSVGKLSFV